MLKFLSKRDRSRKWLLGIFILLLAIGLVGFFNPWGNLGSASADDVVIAEVGEHDVTMKEYRKALRGFAQQSAMGQGAMAAGDPAMIHTMYGSRVLDNLIRSKLVLYEAEERNLEATDHEVQNYIRRQPSFIPWPGVDRYREFLRQNGLTTAEFESGVRAQVTSDKLNSFITSALQVSPNEIEEEYRRNNTNYTIRWVEASPDKFRDKVQVTEPDLRSFYEQNKEQFRTTSQQRRARYIFIDQAKAGESLQASDDELRQAFNPEKGVQQVRVSQIVLNIPKKQQAVIKKDVTKTASDPTQQEQPATLSEDDVRKKALDILARAQGAEGKPAEDFAQLARTYSEDQKTRASGGDIGWVNRKDKRDTDDPLNKVFDMRQNDVSQPIIKGDKFYILKVTERRLPTFEEAREQLLQEARVMKGYTRTVEIATEAEQRLKETKDIDAVAAEINNKYGAGTAVIKETPFFTTDDKLPELGVAADFQSGVFGLQNPGDVANRVNVTNGFAIAQFSDKRDPFVPPYEDIPAQVEDRYRAEKAKGLVAERARQLAQARTVEALNAAAASMGLIPEERASMSSTDSIGPLVSEANREPIYKLNLGEVISEPIQVEGGESYVVAALVSRKDADMGESFQKERKAIEDRLLNAKRGQFFEAFLVARQATLKEKGEIEIYPDRINKAITEGGAGAPIQMPTSPGRPRRTPQGAMPGPPSTPAKQPGHEGHDHP